MNLHGKRFVRSLAVGVLIGGAVIAGLLIFGVAEPPGLDPAITQPFADIDTATLPPVLRYTARDGARLSYREYRSSGTQGAVLVHGSAGSGVDMHPLALALQREGISALVPDLRGHGANQPHGDIHFVGQLDDDLSDLITQKRPEYAQATWTLLGFSSGGGFALRYAAAPAAVGRIDRYLLVSPYLRYDAPSVRQATPSDGASHHWASVGLGRMIGLSMLNQFGIRLWNGLPVLAFPVPADIEATTSTYSWRMYKNFGADDDYLADIRGAGRPLEVFVGGADELIDAEKLKIEFRSQRSEVPVTIVPELGHSDMVTRPEAIRALVTALH